MKYEKVIGEKPKEPTLVITEMSSGILNEVICLQDANPQIDQLFEERKKRLSEKIKKHPLEIVLWEPTRRCNLRCIHCGTPGDDIESSDELTKDEVLNAFQQIRDDFDCRQIEYITITGGEPTVREDLPEIIKELRLLGFDSFVMHTNGHKIALVPGYLELLINSGIRGIGINLDGLEKTHNQIRNHPEAFNLSIKAYEKISSYDNRINTLISTVVTRQNLNELKALREIVFRMNPQRWRLIPLEPIGRALQELPEAILEPADVRFLVEFVLENRLMSVKISNGVITELGCGQWYGERLEGLIRPYIWHCIAGINTLGILYDGSIASCNNIDQHFNQGNVRKDNIRDVWENKFRQFREFEWKLNGECKGCPDWDLCHGGEMHRRRPDGTMIGKCFYRWMEKQGV